MEFFVVDFRHLENVTDKTFDIVLSFDNALPHMQTIDDMSKAISSMYKRIKSGDIYMASIRDYDQIIEESLNTLLHISRTMMMGEKSFLQVWNWHIYMILIYIL